MRNRAIRHAERFCAPERVEGRKTIKKRKLKFQGQSILKFCLELIHSSKHCMGKIVYPTISNSMMFPSSLSEASHGHTEASGRPITCLVLF